MDLEIKNCGQAQSIYNTCISSIGRLKRMPQTNIWFYTSLFLISCNRAPMTSKFVIKIFYGIKFCIQIWDWFKIYVISCSCRFSSFVITFILLDIHMSRGLTDCYRFFFFKEMSKKIICQ